MDSLQCAHSLYFSVTYIKWASRSSWERNKLGVECLMIKQKDENPLLYVKWAIELYWGFVIYSIGQSLSFFYKNKTYHKKFGYMVLIIEIQVDLKRKTMVGPLDLHQQSYNQARLEDKKVSRTQRNNCYKIYFYISTM